MRPVLLALALLGVMVGCNRVHQDVGVVVHGVPVTVVKVSEGNHYARGATIYLNTNRDSMSPEFWVYIMTHELCHVVDYLAGYPSNAWPSGPTSSWGDSASERWADTCSWLWREAEGDLLFVTPYPRVGIDTRSAPQASSVTLEAYAELCEAHPYRQVCD